MEIEIIPLILSLIPALFVAVLSFAFFKLHTSNEERRRRFLLHRENQKQSLPLRLQAYERMALFMERISPGKLLTRIAPIDQEKKSYESLLISTIEQEFEHNLAQQIYITDECWNIIKASKNGAIAMIRKSGLNDDIDSADKMRESILTELIEKGAPTDTALVFIRNEVSDLL
ncbi:hypothetical protein [Aquimarina sp. 2201CG5-10]|uniref:DUF7935 family protein n=1 Tax=Aquimarina callyspongiae TaxID=3098150 RepID=UPI002AB58BBB|nr:hypothetical protein [Aquimarina sp. 2201CG5-10]MDY8135482.1 hypothetical protein [Aquimarina sp. 2201CG5-10]